MHEIAKCMFGLLKHAAGKMHLEYSLPSNNSLALLIQKNVSTVTSVLGFSLDSTYTCVYGKDTLK